MAENKVIQPEVNNDSQAFQSGAKSLMKAYGASGTELFSGYFTEEYLLQIRGKRGAKVYDEMRRSEAQVSMLLNAIMNPIKAGVWEFEAADEDEVPDAELHEDLVEYCLKEMIDFETFLHEALTMLVHGFSMFEVIDQVVFDNEKFGTFSGLKALAFRSQKTIERWNVDRATGELAEVEQWVIGDLAMDSGRSSTIKMLADFLLVFTVQKEGDNYEGISVLRPMYGPWFRKNLYLKIAAIGVEKNAIGTIIGKTPAGKDGSPDLARFKEILGNFAAHESSYVIVPEGWSVEVLKGEFNAAAVKEMLVFENTEMINSVVANFLALGMSGSGGSYSLGNDLSDFFLSGIQNYANIITGVVNRKLIPSLVKKNFGPQSAYPKLKATGINDKAGKELAEIIASLAGSKTITPDMKLEEFLRKSYHLPKPDEASRAPAPAAPTIDPVTGLPIPAPVVPPSNLPTDPKAAKPDATAPEVAADDTPPVKLSEETRLQLDEKYKKNWDANKESVKGVMQDGLTSMLDSLKAQVASAFKNATPAQRLKIGLQLQPKTRDYSKALLEELARIANTALIGAKKETPKAKNVKLAESIQLAAPKGGYYDALPAHVKRIVKSQADLIVQTQAADVAKMVAFQYSSSQSSTDNVDQILKDISDAVEPTIEGATGKGMSVDAAAGNSVASVTNQARLEWFFEPEVLDTIESFTFTNEDPVSDICIELDGTTWAVGDPDLDTYSPPLHHNCKSRLVPNEKGADGNPEALRGGTPISEKALKSITLNECGCNYGLSFETKD